MISLLNGEKKLADLKADVSMRETSILHVMKEFEALSLTTKAEGTYKLTSLGVIEGQLCREYYLSAEVIERFKDFWLSHDLSVIPPNLLLKIGSLKDSVFVKAGATELTKVHETFVQLLLSSKRIKGISPIFHPDFVVAIQHVLEEGDSAALIMSPQVLAKTLTSVKLEQMEEYLKKEKLRIFLNEKPKVALAVTDKCLSLGLFSLNQEYDYRADLVSFSQRAIDWGEELFENVLKNSTRLGIDELGEVENAG